MFLDLLATLLVKSERIWNQTVSVRLDRVANLIVNCKMIVCYLRVHPNPKASKPLSSLSMVG